MRWVDFEEQWFVDYATFYNEVKHDETRNFMVTNNGVEGYNNRMKNVMGPVKVPCCLGRNWQRKFNFKSFATLHISKDLPIPKSLRIKILLQDRQSWFMEIRLLGF